MSGIVFDVETTRILEILSKQIYDSPLALLRENVQNAYDAVLMRCRLTGETTESGLISIILADRKLEISDNGIGMTEDVLRNNFWKAGSSGKNTALARESGVVGTFGIGAMANFGVCSKLTVTTSAYGDNVSLISSAERSKLSIARECITLQRKKKRTDECGTTIVAELDDDNNISEAHALAYITTYVSLLPIKVVFNGSDISRRSYYDVRSLQEKNFEAVSKRRMRQGTAEGDIEVLLDSTGRAIAHLTSVRVDGHSVSGDLFFVQGGGQLMALRSSFGLAPVPTAGHYDLGGFANLSILQPTAGREALSRQSVEHIFRFIGLAEHEISEVIATSDVADRNIAFQNHIAATGRLDLAGKLRIRALPEDIEIPLEGIADHRAGKRAFYYSGRDQGILSMFGNESSVLFHVSQAQPRGKIQQQYLRDVAAVDQVPDSVTLTHVYTARDLQMEEGAVVARVASTLADDYLMPDIQVWFADITHGVTVFAERSGEQTKVYIARGSKPIQPLVECWTTAHEVFGGFIKDFVRIHIFPKISSYVPSSAREGAEALRKILQKKRELYQYEESEAGSIDAMLGSYLSGQIDLGQILKAATENTAILAQSVTTEQVGRIEYEIPGVVDSPMSASESEVFERHEGREYEAAPPIMRPEISSRMKILVADRRYPQLNSFRMFIGLSDKAVKIEGDFLRVPHTTKVLWAGHRVIYVFTESTGRLTLYYDIELKEPLAATAASGCMIPTTTIVSQERIYVPVPDALIDAFKVVSGAKKFFVRFDMIVNPSTDARA